MNTTVSRIKNLLKTAKYPGKYFSKGPADPWLVGIVAIILMLGLVMVYDSSVAIAIRDFDDRYHFVRDQLRWLLIGCVSMYLTYRIDYRFWKRMVVPFMIVTVLLLIAVFIPYIGFQALGARRWISIGPLVIQPAELTKLTLLLYFSAWLSESHSRKFLRFLGLTGVTTGLIVLEPDLGTAMIVFSTSVAQYFFSGAKLGHFFVLVPISTVIVGTLGVIAPYRFQRILSFLNPDADPLGSSYQIRQALLAIGTGGLFGLGFGKSRQKYEYLPEANTDSIFAIFAEEFGLVGCLILIFLISSFIYRGYRVALRAPDAFSRLIAAGITTWIGIQSVLNIAAITGLVPLTGIPLPLISYGGSSLVITLSAIGILLNISRYSSQT